MPIGLTETQVLEALQYGAFEERGLLPYSSNHSFLVAVAHDALTLPAVYKPQRAKRRLWDFEWGTLCKRETAAYLISSALGWKLVPPTVLRECSPRPGKRAILRGPRQRSALFHRRRSRRPLR
jgi:hypothetical protein